MSKKDKNQEIKDVTNNEEAVAEAEVLQAEKKLSKKEQKAELEKKEKAEIKAAMDKEIREHLKSTIVNKKTPFVISEAYKAARTNILFALKDVKGCKKIAISSAEPGEGKSTNAINLAVSFAQMGDRVIIIDSDMRKPTVHKYFDKKNRKGLSNILGGFETFADCVQHDEATGLDIITSGHIPPNPAELLESNEIDTLLENLEGRYDYIIIDTPPINVVADVTILSKKIDGVIVIVRHDVSTKDAIERCVKTLEFAGAKIVGFLLNSVERTSYEGKYSYRKSYRRGYKRYGYGKYGYGKYGYSKYGYSKYGYSRYGYGKYGYSRYGYGSKYGYGYGKYGYGYGYGETPTEESSENK